MALACTKVEAFVREIDEPITKRFTQVVKISFTGANTDVTHDLGAYVAGSLGTLWTAVGADGAAGQAALGILQTLQPSIATGLGVKSPEIEKRTPLGSAATAATNQVVRAVANGVTNLTYFSGDAPTAPTYYIEFDLVNGSHGVKYPSP